MLTIVREGESLAKISSRTGMPSCMLMRANGLFSPAWLLPGREILVPEADFCRKRPAEICPVRACMLPPWGENDRKASPAAPETARNAAKESGLPARLHLLARTLELRVPPGCHAVTVHYGETWKSLAEKTSVAPEKLMRLNRLWNPLLPGMRIVVRGDGPI